MKLKGIFIIVLTSFFLMAFAFPKNLEKRIDKEVKSTFEVSGYTFSEVKVDKATMLKLPAKISKDNFSKISAKGKVLGYVYVDKAPSKTAQFDYLVIFDNNLKIAKTKVLIYREEYGGEIGSKRWLKQFIGKSSKDNLNDIAAISGATISVRSMITAVNDILDTVGLLQQKNYFNEI
ncbi:FMN-binding protein [Gillisia sp. M10.2A]|uniref:FMN-binding protein n=1 Tax=Gillisia lutea TaxID=2909668 RepID=A0ABS9EI43_9FLAO|nr:FMN-binding protein [Gillisia lutea]MCF4102478.1 FMN-binding protein [Gillisia lutea]